jgi:RNA polymerase sigma-70 factor (ECF subfamily)
MFEKKEKKENGTLDEELIRRFAKGDRIAFELIYDRYFKKLVWFATGFTRDGKIAEDVVQDVFIKLIEKPGIFDSDRKFSTWIYTVTGNRCKNIVRDSENRNRLMRENPFTDPVTGSEFQSNFDRRLLQQELSNAIDQLNEKEKSIYVLRFEEEHSIKQISEIISIPEGSVKSGIFHLLKKVAKHLKEFKYENK